MLFCAALPVASRAASQRGECRNEPGISAAVAAAACEQVVLMHLSLVSLKVIKVNNLALTQCPCSPCLAPWITLPKAALW